MGTKLMLCDSLIGDELNPPRNYFPAGEHPCCPTFPIPIISSTCPSSQLRVPAHLNYRAWECRDPTFTDSRFSISCSFFFQHQFRFLQTQWPNIIPSARVRSAPLSQRQRHTIARRTLL